MNESEFQGEIELFLESVNDVTKTMHFLHMVGSQEIYIKYNKELWSKLTELTDVCRPMAKELILLNERVMKNK